MVRKTSDAEAREMQQRQAQATVRKLTRRISNCRDYGEYRDFLAACRVDVLKAVQL